jgi:hypothetical protein
MKTWADAIAYFESIGFFARERNYDFGPSIHVAPSAEIDKYGILIVKDSIYIVLEGDSWFLFDFTPPLHGKVSQAYETLQETVVAAEAYLKQREQIKLEIQ